MRALVRLGTVLALIGSVLLMPTAGGTPTDSAEAADLTYFDPGNIISDAVFFDAMSMDVGAVQAFLRTKGASCVAGEQPCLKDYTQTTATQTGDAYCSTYVGAANESAASIIVKVGQACGINPRVLIVLLQKEQGLVTGTRPATVRYTKATGFACPDTAACNPAFSGFASQVYFAARQFERYAANVAGSYRAGRNNTILFNPSTSCGSSQVFIQNRATAGLYSYTPYQPNAAALAAGYGTGDACSSYGNRNFWNYFTDWFGSTQSPGASAILAAYQNSGGPGGSLGATTSGYLCGLTSGGCWQSYTNGAIYWTPATGAHFVRGAIRAVWGDQGWETGDLGYPVIDESCGLRSSGCWQQFQGGSVYWTPALGANEVSGAILTSWAAKGWEAGSFGYPTGPVLCTGGTCLQEFENGALSSTPGSPTKAVIGAIFSAFHDAGGASVLGMPKIDEACGLVGSGCWQQFDDAAVYWSPATGVAVLRGAIRDAWARTGFEQGTLGYPTSAATCTDAGTCVQSFQKGQVVMGPSGRAFPVLGAIGTVYSAQNGASGWLGVPLLPEGCGLVGGGCWQQFAGGSVYWSPASGAHFVRGAILGSWAAVGWENSSYGYPTSDESCTTVPTSCTSTFQNGAITWTPTYGPVPTRPEVTAGWSAAGGAAGTWGAPSAAARCGLTQSGCAQTFSGGSVYWSPGSGAHLVRGAILSVWTVRGAERSPAGYPVGDETCTTGGCMSLFQNGAMVWSAANGVSFVPSGILAAWQASGGSTGGWGYPVADPRLDGARTTQQFQGGTAVQDANGSVSFQP